MAGHISSRCLKDDFSVIFIPENALGRTSVNASRSATSIMPMICSWPLIFVDDVGSKFAWSSRSVELSNSIVSASVEDGWNGGLISKVRCIWSRVQCGRPSGGLRWLHGTSFPRRWIGSFFLGISEDAGVNDMTRKHVFGHCEGSTVKEGWRFNWLHNWLIKVCQLYTCRLARCSTDCCTVESSKERSPQSIVLSIWSKRRPYDGEK